MKEGKFSFLMVLDTFRCTKILIRPKLTMNFFFFDIAEICFL